jgi:hypothetical protein
MASWASASSFVSNSSPPVGAGGPGQHAAVQWALGDRLTVEGMKGLMGEGRLSRRARQDRRQAGKHSTGSKPACHDTDRGLTLEHRSMSCIPARRSRHFEPVQPLRRRLLEKQVFGACARDSSSVRAAEFAFIPNRDTPCHSAIFFMTNFHLLTQLLYQPVNSVSAQALVCVRPSPHARLASTAPCSAGALAVLT